MSIEPPPFQEATRCDVCKCSFNTFRRRHHCRCCGRTLCHEHSSNQMTLPQFGIQTNVRVCADCFNNSSGTGKDNLQTSSDGDNAVIDTFSRLDIDTDKDPKVEPVVEHHRFSSVLECKCGMPLCICEAPAPVPTTEAHPQQMKSSSTSAVQSNPKPKKMDNTARNRGSTSNSKVRQHSLTEPIWPSPFWNVEQAWTTRMHKGKRLWTVLQLLYNTRCDKRWKRVSQCDVHHICLRANTCAIPLVKCCLSSYDIQQDAIHGLRVN